MPLVLKASQSCRARIVITSSVAHQFGRMRWNDLNWTQFYNSGAAYSQSKLANVLHANALARKLKVIQCDYVIRLFPVFAISPRKQALFKAFLSINYRKIP